MLGLSKVPAFSQVLHFMLDYRFLHSSQGLLPPTIIEPTSFKNSAPNLAGLQFLFRILPVAWYAVSNLVWLGISVSY